MFNLMIILSSMINSEPFGSNNYKIAKYIIENIEDLEDCSVSQLAKSCYVSNSSISRFCRDIGMSDFNALKNQIAKFGISQETTKGKYEFQSYDPHQPAKSYITSVIDNLKLVIPSIDEQAIQKLVKDISQYKNVAAFGYRQSENVALNLQYDLQTNGKHIFTCIKFTEQAEYIEQANQDDLIIIFSDTGTYFDRVFERVKPFKNMKTKPKIYMITSCHDLDIPYVDEYIYYHSRHDYASHPYPLMMIADVICVEYAHMKKIPH